MKEQKKKRRIEGMDALRGFAILGVVLYHVMPGRFPNGIKLRKSHITEMWCGIFFAINY